MGDSRFRAFISYSHADEAWGAWFQRALENYRVPRVLADKIAAGGRSPRLAPVFRDREDLPVAGDLNGAIKAALASSEYQIVLCSPNAAASRWVNEEIKLFHKLHGPGRVFALIISGEPGASRLAGREAEECFPPALRFQLDADGEVTELSAEPLAADARDAGDGKRYAMLKVAAGMLGVGLDDLVRRDAQKRARRLWAITGSSVAATVLTGALAMVAVQQSNEAKRMRGEAEGLIEFMLTDLNEKLEPVGRLDVLESVVDRVMKYYSRQNLKTLNDDALARRAKAMMQFGTVDFRRNNFNEAQKAYETAEAATAELLRRSPNDPDRIFDHAQNVFYVGEAAARRYDRKVTEERFFEYLRLANRLIDLEPETTRSRLEVAYATSNIGSFKNEAGDYAGAIPFFDESIKARKILLDASPSDESLRIAYAYAISWRALSDLYLGDADGAIDLFRAQLAAYGDLASPASRNFTALDDVVTAQRRLGEAHLLKGEQAAAAAAYRAAEETVDRLIARDAKNANWSINAAHIYRNKSIFLANAGDMGGALAAIDRSLELIGGVLTADAPQWNSTAFGQALARRMDLLGARAASSDAERLDALLAAAIQTDALDASRFIGDATLALARFEKGRGRLSRSDAILRRGIGALTPLVDVLPVAALISLAALQVEIGDVAAAGPIIKRLQDLGIRHPEFLALLQHRALARN